MNLLHYKVSSLEDRLSKLETDVRLLKNISVRNFSVDEKIHKPSTEKISQFSGFVIVSLLDPIISKSDDLRALLKKHNRKGLSYFLEKHKEIETRRLIDSVSPDRLLELEKRASEKGTKLLHSLTSYWRFDCRTIDNIEEIVKSLQKISDVDFAYAELPVSQPSVDTSDDIHASGQGYLDAAPVGVDARWAWLQNDTASGDVGGSGEGIGFIDLEQGWFLNHQDLPNPTLIFNDNRAGVGTYTGDHGTAVLGEVVGVDNDVGIVGIAPHSTVRVVSHYRSSDNSDFHVANAIVAAVDVMPVGDVLLLEVERTESLVKYPTEIDIADFDAIKLATALEIIVVEAAGNGDSNLDEWDASSDDSGDYRLNRTSDYFQDSGAILVGSSFSTVEADNGHNRWWTSNYGSRIDCYGWGEQVVTAGDGDLDSGTGDDSSYTDTFRDTSAAAPMIVGCALIVQSMYEHKTGNRLYPWQMRALLSNPTLGTPQSTAQFGGEINVMPNLRLIIGSLELLPDIYIRDSISDDGAVPSVGALSTSPDIIVRPTNVAVNFGEGSGTENSNTEGFEVESGHDNYIYVRMKNRGLDDETATATVFWSEVSTLVTPDMWNLIGTTDPINVPAGGALVVTAPLTWNMDDIPNSGHYCFIGISNSTRDPAPPLPSAIPGFDWDAFLNYIRDYNNVTWRNFNVINI